MSTMQPSSKEAVDRGLNLIIDGVLDLESWREDFARIFEIIGRESGPNILADTAAKKLFEAVDQATAALTEYRAARLKDQ